METCSSEFCNHSPSENNLEGKFAFLKKAVKPKDCVRKLKSVFYIEMKARRARFLFET